MGSKPACYCSSVNGGHCCSADPVTPGLPGRTPSAQTAAWKAYIAWERSNPQRLDGPALAARVSLSYEQALMPLYHHPEVTPLALSFRWQRAESMFSHARLHVYTC